MLVFRMDLGRVKPAVEVDFLLEVSSSLVWEGSCRLIERVGRLVGVSLAVSVEG